jgi:hypothetical protein
VQDETPKKTELLFNLPDHSSESDTTDNESTNKGNSTNDKVVKQDETTINDGDTGSEVVVSGSVPTPVTEKRNNKTSSAGNTIRRKVSYVDNHSL